MLSPCVKARIFIHFFMLAVASVSASPAVQRQQGYCSESVTLAIGQTETLTSPYFPYAYPNGLRCVWIATSPPNTAIRLTCNQFFVAPSRSCILDSFYFSPSGDTTLQNSNYYCGQIETLDLITDSNVFAAGFITQSFYANYYPGFSCLLTVIEKSGGISGEQTPDLNTSVTAAPTTPPTSDDCQCGIKGQSRIVGGQETGINEWPWQAGMRFMKTGDIFCGASLIDDRWLVTAAHCVEQFQKEEIYVSLGEHDKNQISESSFTQHIAIDKIIMHENYDPNTVDNDIAVIRLSGPVTFNDGIRPVCLPFKFASNDFSGESGTVTGWGQLTFNGEVSNVLQEVELPILTTAECQQYDIVAGSITENMLCTYSLGLDACKGDSGGPLHWGKDGRQYLIGLVSFGQGCADKDSPGVYTKVTNYLQWIQKKTSANLCTPS